VSEVTPAGTVNVPDDVNVVTVCAIALVADNIAAATEMMMKALAKMFIENFK
jgi:hypothetical protein